MRGTGLPGCGELPMTWIVQFSASGFPVLRDSMGWGGREGSEPTLAPLEHPTLILPKAQALLWGVEPPRPTLVSSATPSVSLGQLSSSTSSLSGCLAGGCAGAAVLCEGQEPAQCTRCSRRGSRVTPHPLSEGPRSHKHPPAPHLPSTGYPPRQHWGRQSSGVHRAWGPARPHSPSPWHPGGAASPGWPRCSRAGAGRQGWRRRARGGGC